MSNENPTVEEMLHNYINTLNKKESDEEVIDFGEDLFEDFMDTDEVIEAESELTESILKTESEHITKDKHTGDIDTGDKEALNINVKKLVYISHPSSGLEENTLDIEKIVRRLYKEDDIFNEYCFLSPVHNYGFMYHDTDYHRGLSYCTDLLYFCDEMWVFGDWKKSTGCKAEVELASKLGIKTRFLGYSSDLEKVIVNKSYKVDSYINTPSQKREVTRNKTLFVYIDSSVLDKLTNNKLAKYIELKLLYKTMEDAYKKISTKTNKEKYVLLEVDVDGNSVMDLEESNTALKLNKFARLAETIEELEESIKAFALANNKKVIKRVVRGNRKISDIPGCEITMGNKEVYKILDTSCIKDIKVYDTYVINDSEQIRAFTFVKSFN